MALSNPNPQALAAIQIVNQVNSLAANLTKLLSDGIPARGNQTAISASDLVEALGTSNVSKIQAVIAAVA